MPNDDKEDRVKIQRRLARFKNPKAAMAWLVEQDYELAAWACAQLARDAITALPKREPKPLHAIELAEKIIRGGKVSDASVERSYKDTFKLADKYDPKRHFTRESQACAAAGGMPHLAQNAVGIGNGSDVMMSCLGVVGFATNALRSTENQPRTPAKKTLKRILEVMIASIETFPLDL